VIRAAYKALAMLYHPDLGGDPERMVELNQAYETLLDKN
jgi:curved DNA-binding protein CbpA